MKRYLITGVSAGIGAAIAKRVLADGAEVVGLGRHAPQWTEDPRLKFVPLDLSDLDEVERVLQKLKRDVPSLDAVISNAGAGLFGQLESLKASEIRASMDLNLTAHLLLARALLPGMKTAGRGTFVFMGSEAALHGAKNGAVYCAAKFGLRGLAQSLRADCARSGVRVSIVHPGMVNTNFFDELWFRPGDAAGQALDPDYVADAVIGVCNAPDGAIIEEMSLSPQVKTVVIDKGR
jgi:3-hydroxy acid dehydrogenase/malonic semialdehyde reductase